jgi:PAS domain S-box-containing protein
MAGETSEIDRLNLENMALLRRVAKLEVESKRQLQESAEVICGIVNSAPFPIFSLDRLYRYTSFNDAHAAVMKALYGVDIAIGRSLFEYQTVDEDKRKAKSNIDQALLGNHIVENAHSGDEILARRYFEVAHDPIRNGVGEVIGVAVWARDITERRRLEEDLVKARDMLEQQVAERTADLHRNLGRLDETSRLAHVGWWDLNLTTNELTWSDDVKRIHEVDPSYQPTLEAGINFYAPEALPVISEAIKRLSESGSPFDVELPFVTAKSRRIWVRAIGKAYWENGLIARIGGVFQDLTERKRADDELRAHRDRLEAANNELEAFSYSVSHDLRAPLRAIDGFTRILMDDYASHLDDEGKRICSIVRENTERMGRLIDDLPAFSRLGRTAMQPSRIDMRTMANSVFHELTSKESRYRSET